MYMHGRGPLENIQLCTCMGGSLIEDHLFGSMDEDEECDYDHTLIDDSSAQVVTGKIVVLEKTIQTCTRMLSYIETELMESHVENDLHEDLELQSEL